MGILLLSIPPPPFIAISPDVVGFLFSLTGTYVSLLPTLSPVFLFSFPCSHPSGDPLIKHVVPADAGWMGQNPEALALGAPAQWEAREEARYSDSQKLGDLQQSF